MDSEKPTQWELLSGFRTWTDSSPLPKVAAYHWCELTGIPRDCEAVTVFLGVSEPS